MTPEDIARMNEFFETHSYDVEPEDALASEDAADDPEERGDKVYAAGVVFLTDDGRVLLLLRSEGTDAHPETWAFPGGCLEAGESTEDAAVRECREEMGMLPRGPRRVLCAEDDGNVHYTTFLQRIPNTFAPKLNHEHDDYVWVDPTDPPDPLHPGVAEALARLN